MAAVAGYCDCNGVAIAAGLRSLRIDERRCLAKNDDMKTCAAICIGVGALAIVAAVGCLFAAAIVGAPILALTAAWLALSALGCYCAAAALDGLASLIDVAERQLAATNRLLDCAAKDEEFQSRQIEWLTHIAERLPPVP